jgi:hypothetical protein
MNLDFSDNQKQGQAQVRRFLTERRPSIHVPERVRLLTCLEPERGAQLAGDRKAKRQTVKTGPRSPALQLGAKTWI